MITYSESESTKSGQGEDVYCRSLDPLTKQRSLLVAVTAYNWIASRFFTIVDRLVRVVIVASAGLSRRASVFLDHRVVVGGGEETHSEILKSISNPRISNQERG